jgi:hypothetical protein
MSLQDVARLELILENLDCPVIFSGEDVLAGHLEAAGGFQGRPVFQGLLGESGPGKRRSGEKNDELETEKKGETPPPERRFGTCHGDSKPEVSTVEGHLTTPRADWGTISFSVRRSGDRVDGAPASDLPARRFASLDV